MQAPDWCIKVAKKKLGGLFLMFFGSLRASTSFPFCSVPPQQKGRAAALSQTMKPRGSLRQAALSEPVSQITFQVIFNFDRSLFRE